VPESLPEPPDRSLALGLVRATEAAAIAASAWMGRGDKDAADGVAVPAMRRVLSTVLMKGVVVIGKARSSRRWILEDAPCPRSLCAGRQRRLFGSSTGRGRRGPGGWRIQEVRWYFE